MNYYSEWDPKAATWLRELIKAGEIPEGHVDERSITDVKSSDLRGYVQCHFFAGIGGWCEALRLAGVPSTRPLWTASLPCQPFSAAGKQLGVEDERHLWPIFFDLVKKCRPDLIFGEQVARAIGFNWLDGIRSDLEIEDYAIGAAVLGAHSVRAPHKRMRLNWLANSSSYGWHEGCGREPEAQIRKGRNRESQQRSGVDSLADTEGTGCEDHLEPGQKTMLSRTNSDRPSGDALGVTKCSGLEGFAGNVDHGNQSGRERAVQIRSIATSSDVSSLAISNEQHGHGTGPSPSRNGGEWKVSEAICGFWDNAVWLNCLDGKARRVEPGIQPLAHGVSGRVGLLRGAGNAIVPQASAEFIKAFLEIEREQIA